MVSWGKQKGVIRVFRAKKAVVQVLLIAAGIAMVCFGALRGEVLSLTRKETGILEYLLLHQGRPVSQEELLEHVWDSGADGFGNSIRVHISALRKKLRAALGYDPIRNRIGEGYVMEEQI